MQGIEKLGVVGGIGNGMSIEKWARRLVVYKIGVWRLVMRLLVRNISMSDRLICTGVNVICILDCSTTRVDSRM